MKYTAKPTLPIEAEALQWDGTYKGLEKIWFEFKGIPNLSSNYHKENNTVAHWRIQTLQGGEYVCKGDYIVKHGDKGYTVCTPDIFEATYILSALSPSHPPTSQELETIAAKSLDEITDAECIEATRILGSGSHLTEDSQAYQFRELIEGWYNQQTNIPGIRWYRVFQYLRSREYAIDKYEVEVGLLESRGKGDDAIEFAEWIGGKYVKCAGGWFPIYADQRKQENVKTIAELYELFKSPTVK